MEQQINLYQPIMGAGNPIFSAQASAAAVAVFAVCLIGISGFAGSRVRHVEKEVTAIESQDGLRAAAVERMVAALQPSGGMEALEARTHQLVTDIDDEQHVLDAVRYRSDDAATGFAARLEALGRYQLEGLWLTRIVLSTGLDQLALTGAARDPALVPAYLSALATARSFADARFDRFQLRQPTDGEPAAATIFEIGAPARPAAGATP